MELDKYNYDTLLELYCIAWYTKFKRFPAPQRIKIDKETLIHKIDLLRRHR